MSPEIDSNASCEAHVQYGYVRSEDRDLFRVVVEPECEWQRDAVFVLVPPFDGEANRSRQFLSSLLRCLAKQGATGLLTDHYGTGDSQGEFADARWKQWCLDLEKSVTDLGRKWPVVLVGLRAGCLLIDSLSTDCLANVHAVVEIAPETSARALLRRWLMVESSRRRFTGERNATVGDLRQELASGHRITVSGYPLSPELANDLNAGRERRSPESGGGVQPTTTVIDLWPDSSVLTTDLPDESRREREVADLSVPRFWQLDDAIVPEETVSQVAAQLIALCEGPTSSRRLGSSKCSVGRVLSPRSSSGERPVKLNTSEGVLPAIFHEPLVKDAPRTCVILITGGGQYRVGAHRQFVILGRSLAECGFAVLRFDLTGRGDASGAPRHFLENDQDIEAAVAWAETASEIDRIVLWGLCDGASAAAVYSSQHRRGVSGVVLVNPWIHTEAGAARVRLGHYYLKRLLSRGLFANVILGRINIVRSLIAVFGEIATAMGGSLSGTDASDRDSEGCLVDDLDLPSLILGSLRHNPAPVLIVLAQEDETALEFAAAFDRRFGAAADRGATTISKHELPGDHTFSRGPDHLGLVKTTRDWLATIG